MKLNSPAFSAGSSIPGKYTCDGEDVSPPLEWSNVPAETKSFVLICDDPDAIPVAGHVWDHWVLYNIPADTSSIAENSSAGTEGMTSFGKTCYGGPCPPNGKHLYFFKLYALDTTIELPAGATKEQVEKVMKGHVLAQAELKEYYDRLK